MNVGVADFFLSENICLFGNRYLMCLRKFVPKAQDLTIFYWLFSKSGFTKEVLEEAKSRGIQTVTVEDMV